jgi:hypothetical protein
LVDGFVLTEAAGAAYVIDTDAGEAETVGPDVFEAKGEMKLEPPPPLPPAGQLFEPPPPPPP